MECAFLESFSYRAFIDAQGFSIIQRKTLFFRPPLSNEKSLQKLLALEKLGELCWPSYGGVYLLVARKRIAPLIPIAQNRYAPSRVAVGKAQFKPTGFHH